MHFLPLFLFLVATWLGLGTAETSFKVDLDNNQFLLDGKPFRYISGDIHYFRIHPDLWEDRLKRVRALGFNAIQYYIPWNFHQPDEKTTIFGGDRNFTRFSEIAMKLGMYSLLRIGPYICGEWENGGLPWFLLKKHDIMQRSADPAFLAATAKWYDKLLPVLAPMMRHNGGSVLMVQVENEYGSYASCDNTYLQWLRDYFWKYLGNQTQLYTTDPSENLNCGTVDGVYATVDFGPNKDVDQCFDAQRKYTNGKGPLVNSEFYPGWYTVWGQGKPNLGTTQEMLDSLGKIYAKGASVSVYMIHGGTNFGFWNGAEYYGGLITSYDYFAPISETGDLTQAYLALRLWMKTLKDWPNPPQNLPQNNKKLSYGIISLHRISSLADAPSQCQSADHPLTFEEMNHGYGFLTHATTLAKCGQKLSIKELALRDRADIFLDKKYVGTAEFLVLTANIPPSCISGQSEISLLVENTGRLTWETTNDNRGILSDVTMDGVKLTNWTTCAVQMNNQLHEFVAEQSSHILGGDPVPPNADLHGIYTGTIQVSAVADTFIDFSLWGKGVLFVNGQNLGRYYSEGPQMTLYVPAPYLQLGTNTITIVELKASHYGCTNGCLLPTSNSHIWKWK